MALGKPVNPERHSKISGDFRVLSIIPALSLNFSGSRFEPYLKAMADQQLWLLFFLVKSLRIVCVPWISRLTVTSILKIGLSLVFPQFEDIPDHLSEDEGGERFLQEGTLRGFHAVTDDRIAGVSAHVQHFHRGTTDSK